MKSTLIAATLLMLAGATSAAPVVYTDEPTYLDALAAVAGSTIHESFENDTAWEDSRNSISSPGQTPAVTSLGVVWTSNYFAFGGRIDTANSGKVTFLLDGVDINGNDTDNIDNWQREGD